MKRKTTAFIMAITLLLAGCGAPRRTDRQGFAMGTFINISVYNTRYAKYADECIELIKLLESEVSINLADSTISRLNENGSARLQGDAAEILRAAQQVQQATGGAFNVGVLPLQRLWDVQHRQAESNAEGSPPPDDEAIEQARLLCLDGIDMVDEGDVLNVSMQPGRGVDLGGIAKGYAGDRCAELLKQKGVDNAIINIGGNVRTLGDGEYRIGLRNPRGAADELYGLVTVGECNVITSGDYERYFEYEGVRYHHIFDPSTGQPARSGLMSATAIGRDGAIADGLSTAIFVLGKDAGLALAEDMGYEAIVVADDYSVYCTDGIRNALEITDDSFQLAEQ